MKKLFNYIVVLILIIVTIVGCSVPHEEAKQQDVYTYGKGYFTTVKTWGGGGNLTYSIVYANDTKVMYFIASGGQAYGITPLYDSDGTVQLYVEE